LINISAEENLDGSDSQSNPTIGDIKIEYHTDTKKVPEFIPFKKYQARQKFKKSQSNTRNPWKPFKTRSDFEFAEVSLRAGLTKNQVNRLIEVMQRCIDGKDSFNIRDHDHMSTIWEAGAVLHTAVSFFLFHMKIFYNPPLRLSISLKSI
jgi:hypothetical protein